MTKQRPFTEAVQRLRGVGLRPTRQRIALARLLFDEGDRHVTAEQLHAQAQEAELGVSLATVYNALNQFTHAGLMREVVVEPGRSYFDTNTSDHHHFFVEGPSTLLDIPADGLSVDGLPEAPEGTEVKRIDVIVRLRPNRSI